MILFLKYAVNSLLDIPPHHITRWPDKTPYYLTELFNMDLIDLHHEKCQDYHRLWYLTTLLSNSLINHKIVDLSISTRIIIKLCSLLAKILIKGLKEEMLPFGHTVIVVYRKKGR